MTRPASSLANSAFGAQVGGAGAPSGLPEKAQARLGAVLSSVGSPRTSRWRAVRKRLTD